MSHVPNQPAIREETLDVLGQSFVEDVSRYVLPIFIDVDGVPMSVGTGFLLHTGRDHVLVTAAHVLNGIGTEASYYFYAAPNLKRTIAGQALIARLPPSGRRADDVIDVAAVVLAGRSDELPPFPLVGKDSMSLENLSAHASPRSERKYAFLGFPASKATVNRIARDVRSASYAYLGSSAPSSLYAELHLEEGSHILLPFAKRNVVTFEGAKYNFPSPKGMSGSPLWELRKPEHGGRKVVGVMIEHRKQENVFVAADIGFVLRFLSEHDRASALEFLF